MTVRFGGNYPIGVNRGVLRRDRHLDAPSGKVWEDPVVHVANAGEPIALHAGLAGHESYG